MTKEYYRKLPPSEPDYSNEGTAHDALMMIVIGLAAVGALALIVALASELVRRVL